MNDKKELSKEQVFHAANLKRKKEHGVYPGGYEDAISDAMEEYAKQQCIAFNEWLSENFWVRDPFRNKHTNEFMWTKYGEEVTGTKTINQLYDKYLIDIENK